MNTNALYIVHHHPTGFAGRSGFPALIETLGARELAFSMSWQKLAPRSWHLSNALRKWGRRHYGSEWNGLIPCLDEWRLARQIEGRRGAVIHFIWGEFASPRHPDWFRKRDNRLVSTFHCSARRLPVVLKNFRCWNAYDAWSVTSKTQVPFFLDHGVHAQDIRVLPLGVDTDYFRPAQCWHAPEGGPLRAILVGQTERDHEFTAAVFRALPPGLVELSVCTHQAYQSFYRDVPGVRLMPFLSDEQLLQFYQEAELMLMPFLDCTTNDAIMEAMACGTPVMTNQVGGIPEYVNPLCNVLMEDKRVPEWVDRLKELAAGREALWGMRGPVRRWAETFSWAVVAEAYRAFYEGRPSP